MYIKKKDKQLEIKFLSLFLTEESCILILTPHNVLKRRK